MCSASNQLVFTIHARHPERMDARVRQKAIDTALTKLGALLVVSNYAFLFYSGWERSLQSEGCGQLSCVLVDTLNYIDGNRAFRIWGEVGGAKIHLLKVLTLSHVIIGIGLTSLFFIWQRSNKYVIAPSLLPDDSELLAHNLKPDAISRPIKVHALIESEQIKKRIPMTRAQIRTALLAC